MGWWQTNSETVIGDGLADVCGDHLYNLVYALVEEYPDITKEQVLETIAFCAGYIPHFDDDKEATNEDSVLCMMTANQREDWRKRHKVEPNMSIRVASATDLLNVKNPFTGDVV